MEPLLKKVDAVTVHVPDLDSALGFYGDRFGHPAAMAKRCTTATRWAQDNGLLATIGSAATGTRAV